jgi:DNA-binding MarR family transcriptional regulator
LHSRFEKSNISNDGSDTWFCAGHYLVITWLSAVQKIEHFEYMAGKSFYFTIQSWMLDLLELPLSDVAVYAYIHGLTNSEELGKQGWHGSRRRLAKILHVSPSTMNDIINRLWSKGYIHIYNGFITSTIDRSETPKKTEEIPSESAGDRNPDTFSGDGTSDIPF